MFDTMLPHATQIADPFPVVKLANFVLDETRRRVQNQTCGIAVARPIRSIGSAS